MFALYGCEGIVLPSGEDEVPAVNCQTLPATEITFSSAKLGGEATVDGTYDGKIYAYFYYTTNPQDHNDISKYGEKIDVGEISAASGSFSASLTDLSPETDYYYVAAVSYGDKLSVGKLVTFKTAAKPTAITTTGDVVSVTEDSAVLTSYINPTLVSGEIEMGILYSTEAEFTMDTGTAVTSKELDANNMFTVQITKLTAATKYYYKSYVKSSGIYQFGEVKSFETKAIGYEVVVTTEDVSFEWRSICLNGKVNVNTQTAPIEASFFASVEPDDAGAILANGSQLPAEIREDGTFYFKATVDDLIGYDKTFYFIAVVNLYGHTYCGEVKSCTTPPRNYLSVTPTELNFSAEGGTETIVFTAISSWRISDIPEWLSLSSTSGGDSLNEQSISVTALQNTAYNREAMLVFTAGESKATITINQAGTLGEFPTGSGTQEDPYTVAQAVESVKNLWWNSSTDYEKVGPYYVKGRIVSIREEYGTAYGNATFTISDDGATSGATLLAYRIYYLQNQRWQEGNKQIQVGDEVVIYGELCNYYGNTPEMVQKSSYLYSLNGETEPSGGEVVDYNNAPSKTVADFISEANTATYYKLKGTVSSFNSTYCSFDLTDETGTIYVYSVENKDDWRNTISDGGTVELAGKYSYYSAKDQHEVVNAQILSFESAGQPAIDGQYGYDVAPMGWLELPATVKGDGRELLVHAMDGGKYVSRSASGVRNWSGYWDYDEHLSLWVAYPLNNALKGSGSRSNAWGFDPLLPANIQPDITSGSYGGGWTRGHQIPSADRLASYAANASTFVPTNMTPQNYDFNCGIWANLENAVRSYASQSDTLYVVTGCLFENSTSYSGSNTGFAVKIPTHYYKALLYRGSSSYATNGFMACAFLMPHDSSIANYDYKSYIMTIDELEQQTGIDFFPNLEAVLGKDKADSIESSLSSWW